ncbi:hypothetical protein [Streptomyces pseudovenezuelae]|uniref:Uncharacterized protein n=1 Tax=Streptomyces pseudovenezuelae TaxID=67350 RepID=A0ABT6LC84_9ACTN|nr:hypothetical protein [Streptomyces pseudovenezuelae]MDH6213912.1 hypothetical protein [Streptomyces pseudovenezuelae]
MAPQLGPGQVLVDMPAERLPDTFTLSTARDWHRLGAVADVA